MSHFPVQYSTLSAVALKKHIEDAYNLKLISCKFLLRGVSDTYIIEATDTKYVFKVYREQHRSYEEILSEVELLDILKIGGANVAYAIADSSNSQVQKFNAPESTRYGILLSYAEGKPVLDLNREQLKTVGRQMAAVHNITAIAQLKYPRRVYNNDTTLLLPIKTIAPAFVNLPAEYSYLQETAAKVIEKLGTFNTAEFSYGYCQYDFLPKNFHFNESGVITFFDFDFAGRGYLVNDLMSFFVHFFMHVATGKLTDAEADRMYKVFVSAYREVRPITDEEIAAIPYLGVGFWVFYLGFQYENFDDWSNLFFGERYLKDRVGIIKTWVDKYCEF